MTTTKVSEFLQPISRGENVDSTKEYKMLGVKWYAKGVFIKAILLGKDIKAKKVYRVEVNDFIYNRLFAWKGSFALITEEFDGCYVSNEFPFFTVDSTKILPLFLQYYFNQEQVWTLIEQKSKGVSGISRKRFKERNLLDIDFPLVNLKDQEKVVNIINLCDELENKLEKAKSYSEKFMQSVLQKVFAKKQ